MSFPTIPTAAAGRVLTGVQANTTATRTFPSLSGLTKNAGDLLIAICVAYQSGVTNAAFSGWTAGWTEFHDSSSSTTMAIGMAYKWSTGSETGTISVTQAATITGHASFILLSIPGAHATSPPEAGSRASGTTAAADPASFNPSWAAEDILWIAVGGAGEVSTTGSFTGVDSPSPPANFTNGVETAISQDVAGGVSSAVAFRQLNADSLDVGTWVVDITSARNAAVVVAVRPVASATVTLTPATLKLNAVAVSPNPTSQVTITPAVLKIQPGSAPMWGAGVVDASATVYNPGNVQNTSHALDMPDTIAVGNALLFVFAARENCATSVTGWTKIVDASGSAGLRLVVGFRIADGTEGATVTLTTSVATCAIGRVFRIPGWQLTHPAEGATRSIGNNNTPDPPSFDPSGWATDTTLWFAIFDLLGAATATAYPFSDNQWTAQTASGTFGRVGIGVCTTLSVASSIDPGTFTSSGAGNWAATTVALHAAVPATPGQVTLVPAVLKLQAPFIGAFPGAATLTPAVLKLRAAQVGPNQTWGLPLDIDNTGATNVSTAIMNWLNTTVVAGHTAVFRPGSYWVPQGIPIEKAMTLDLNGAMLFTGVTLGPEDPNLTQSQIDYPAIFDHWDDSLAWLIKRSVLSIAASNVNVKSSQAGARIQGASRRVNYRGGNTDIPEGCVYNSTFDSQHCIRIGYQEPGGTWVEVADIDIDLTNISVEFPCGDGIYCIRNTNGVVIHGAQQGPEVVNANLVISGGVPYLGATGGLPDTIDVGGGGGGSYDLWVPGSVGYPGIHHTGRQGWATDFQNADLTIRDISIWRVGRTAIDIELAGPTWSYDPITIQRVEFGHWYLGHINNPYDGAGLNVLIEDCISYKQWDMPIGPEATTPMRRTNWTVRRNRYHMRKNTAGGPCLEMYHIDGLSITDNYGPVESSGQGWDIVDSTSVTTSPAEDVQFFPTTALVAAFITPPTLKLTAVPVTPVGSGPGSVTLTRPTLKLQAVALSPVGQPGTVTLTPPTVKLTAVPVTPTPGPGAVTLTRPTLKLVAIPVSPTGQPGTVTLTRPTLRLVAVALSPLGQPGTLTLTPAVLRVQAGLASPGSGPGAVTITAAVLKLGIGSIAVLTIIYVPPPVEVAILERANTAVLTDRRQTATVIDPAKTASVVDSDHRLAMLDHGMAAATDARKTATVTSPSNTVTVTED